MGLKDFMVQKNRALPIFVLADASGSMDGVKIAAVNKALQDMVATLSNAKGIRGEFKVCVISFGGHGVEVVQELTEVHKVQIPELKAIGRTPLGAALDKVCDMIEDREIVKKSDYQPTVLLLSDGWPTDYDGENNPNAFLSWAPMHRFHTGERSKKSLRLAMSMGKATDPRMLKAFMNNENNPVTVSNIQEIDEWFQWVTMSSITRMSSPNPDYFGYMPHDNDDEIII